MMAGKYIRCKASSNGWNCNGCCCFSSAGYPDSVLISAFHAMIHLEKTQFGCMTLHLSHEKKNHWLLNGCIGGMILPSYMGIFKKLGSLLNNQDSMESKAVFFSWLTCSFGFNDLVFLEPSDQFLSPWRRFIPRSLAEIFSNDPAVLDKFEECRFPFAAFVVWKPRDGWHGIFLFEKKLHVAWHHVTMNLSAPNWGFHEPLCPLELALERAGTFCRELTYLDLPNEQWKNPWLVVWYRGLYYPVIWGF